MDVISQDKKRKQQWEQQQQKKKQTNRQTDNEKEKQTETDKRRKMYIFVVCVRLQAVGFYMLRPFAHPVVSCMLMRVVGIVASVCTQLYYSCIIIYIKFELWQMKCTACLCHCMLFVCLILGSINFTFVSCELSSQSAKLKIC